MNITLTQALLATAALALLGLVLHGWWSARRLRAKRPLEAPDTTSGARTEPSLGPSQEADDTQPELRPALRHTVQLDALIDALVPLSLESPVSGDAVLAHLPASRRAGSKPFYIEGLDTETGEWDAPTIGRRYGDLQAGVQLANRTGALNQIEYSEFVQKVQTFAENLGAEPDFPDMLEVVARAKELDALTSGLDAQLALTLRSNGVAWSVGYIQQCAARQGFVPGVLPGRMVMPSGEDGAPPVLLLTVDSQAALAALGEAPAAPAVREFALGLDVPQTPQRAEPYPAWHRAAMALADDMDATAVDDQGRPLTLSAFASIANDLLELYARLEALDLAAGSPAARRLFS